MRRTSAEDGDDAWWSSPGRNSPATRPPGGSLSATSARQLACFSPVSHGSGLHLRREAARCKVGFPSISAPEVRRWSRWWPRVVALGRGIGLHGYGLTLVISIPTWLNVAFTLQVRTRPRGVMELKHSLRFAYRVLYFVSCTTPLGHAALTYVKSVNESLLRVSVGLRSGGTESGYPAHGEDRKERTYSQFKRDVSDGFPHVLDSGLALYRLLRTLAHGRRIVFPSSPCRIEDEMYNWVCKSEAC